MGLLGTMDTSSMYKTLLLGLKSSTWSKNCPRKALADSVEGGEGRGAGRAGRAVRFVLLSLVFHIPIHTQRLAFPDSWPCLPSIPANDAVGHFLPGLWKFLIVQLTSPFPWSLMLLPGQRLHCTSRVPVWTLSSLWGWRHPRTAQGTWRQWGRTETCNIARWVEKGRNYWCSRMRLQSLQLFVTNKENPFSMPPSPSFFTVPAPLPASLSVYPPNQWETTSPPHRKMGIPLTFCCVSFLPV